MLVADRLIKTIPSFEDGKPVYAAGDNNGWLLMGSLAPSPASEMTKEGECWRAAGLRDVRFAPVQFSPEGKPNWAKIEYLYPLDSCFVDTSGTGPSLKVPGRCPIPTETGTASSIPTPTETPRMTTATATGTPTLTVAPS